MITKTYSSLRNKEGKTHNVYKCEWCNEEFERFVRNFDGGGKHGGVSTQVKCSKCGNFIKTWE